MTTLYFILFYISLLGLASLLGYRSFFWYLAFQQKKAEKMEKKTETEKIIQEKTVEKPKKEEDEVQPETKEHRKETGHSHEIIGLLKKAEISIARKEYDDAKKFLIKILSWDEDHAEANSHLGFIYLQTGNFKRSEDIYRKALKEKPNDPSILTNFALSIFQQKTSEKIQESIDALHKSVEMDPHNPERYTNLGQSLFFAGEKETAAEYFEKAVQLSPKNIDFLFFLGDTYISLEEKEKAMRVFEKILEISPFDEEAKRELEELRKR